MKQALDFLRSGHFVYPTKIATDLEEALAKQEQGEPVTADEKLTRMKSELAYMRGQQEQGEPVAWISWNRVSGESKLNYHKVSSQHDATLWSHFPLYTTPQQRKPLTDEQIEKLLDAVIADKKTKDQIGDFARAIEAAHGIIQSYPEKDKT